MSVTAVHQFVPTLAPRDAIGAHALAVQSLLVGMGLRSELFADTIHPELAGQARSFLAHAPRFRSRPRRGAGREVLLYQASTGSRVADHLLARPEPKLVNYHNITPAWAFAGWEPELGREVATGRRQLARLAPVSVHAIAVSRFNQAELVDAGFGATSVAPLLVDLSPAAGEAPGAAAGEVPGDSPGVHAPTLERLERWRQRGSASWLFVGRVVPNKAQHDLVRALAVYRRLYDPRARLHLVGGATSPAYLHALRRLVARLGVGPGVEVAGSVSRDRLAAYYRGADVFVCLSDHEGFCAPLVEAMHHRLPIVAFASSAVPETIGDAGVVMASKDPLAVAATVSRVLGDDRLRASLAGAAEARVMELSPEVTRPAFVAAVRAALAKVV